MENKDELVFSKAVKEILEKADPEADETEILKYYKKEMEKIQPDYTCSGDQLILHLIGRGFP